MSEISAATPSAEKRPTPMAPRSFSHDPVPQVAVEHRRKTDDFSKALGVRPVTFSSHHVQMLFEHHFERTDHALYIATKAARNQHRVKEARVAENEIHRLLDDYGKSLSANLATLQKQLETAVPEEFRTILYDHKREFKAPIRTGYSQRLLALTLQLDTLIGIIENLELNNVLTPENSDKSIKSWIRYYRQLCSAIQKIRKDSVSHPDGKTLPSGADKTTEETTQQPAAA